MKIHVRENQMEEIEGITPEFPYTCHHVDMRTTRVPWHWHEEVEFDRVKAGEVRLRLGGRVLSFAKGEGYFTNANVLSSLEGSHDAVLESHIFHPVFLTGHFHSVFETKYVEPVLHNQKIEVVELRGATKPQREILALLERAEMICDSPDQEMRLRNIFSDIWMYLLEEIVTLKAEEPKVPKVNQERLMLMISFIQEHASEKISLEQIAGAASISTREALRCFQKGLGETPYEYLMGQRVEMAEKLLRQTDLSALDIANDTGFSSGAYFAKIFKRSVGMTPLQYRRRSREG